MLSEAYFVFLSDSSNTVWAPTQGLCQSSEGVGHREGGHDNNIFCYAAPINNMYHTIKPRTHVIIFLTPPFNHKILTIYVAFNKSAPASNTSMKLFKKGKIIIF